MITIINENKKGKRTKVVHRATEGIIDDKAPTFHLVKILPY